jgi:drug/metabolite transporter (DMT)-like permease
VAHPGTLRTTLATAAALAGFAANSLLCRKALLSVAIDAASFTALRLLSGAIVLALLERAARRGAPSRSAVSIASALALFAYAAAFSYAYLRLGAGVGALVLFACVQVTMIGWDIREGARPRPTEWAGLALALAGLVLLTLPGADVPDPAGLVLMALAGAAWGIYSLRGRGSRAPLAATASNFARSVPFALAGLALAAATGPVHATARGAWLAVASGALASGVGYSLWYLALPGLGATRAALVQLVVPVLAAGAGIALLGERASPRLALSAALILGGVAIAVLVRRRRAA